MKAVHDHLAAYHPQLELQTVADPREAAAGADVVLATAGPGTAVALESADLAPGSTVVLVGYGLAPSTLVDADRVVATSAEQMALTGTDMAARRRAARVDAELPQILSRRVRPHPRRRAHLRLQQRPGTHRYRRGPRACRTCHGDISQYQAAVVDEDALVVAGAAGHAPTDLAIGCHAAQGAVRAGHIGSGERHLFGAGPGRPGRHPRASRAPAVADESTVEPGARSADSRATAVPGRRWPPSPPRRGLPRSATLCSSSCGW